MLHQSSIRGLWLAISGVQTPAESVSSGPLRLAPSARPCTACFMSGHTLTALQWEQRRQERLQPAGGPARRPERRSVVGQSRAAAT